MYYNITFFYNLAPTKCIINPMDLKIFSNINMLLKVDHFKRFSNQSNIDELVINSMSACNCNNYKLNDNNYRCNSNLA